MTLKWQNSKKYMRNWRALYGNDEALPLEDKASAPRRGNDTPTEYSEQVRFVRWLKKHGVLFFSIPNDGNRSPLERLKKQSSGLVAGVPDLMICVPVAPFGGLFIEMKRREGSNLSVAQKTMIAKLKTAGYAVMIAYGALDAMMITRTYLLKDTGEMPND